MKKNGFIRELVFYAIVLAVLFTAIYGMTGVNTSKSTTVLSSYDELVLAMDDKDLESVYVSNKNVVSLTYADKTVKQYKLADFSIFYNDFQEDLLARVEAGTLKSYQIQPAATTPWWLSILPYVLILGIMVVMFIMAMKQGGGGRIGGFTKTHAKVNKDEKKVTFADVAGADEEKEELVEIVDFLKDPAKYTKLGARIPRGVLLVGPPGTGKTLLAKAVAGEADVPFFSISGSDFVEMYVGVGASRVRDLFENARKFPASIIFIDEIDAVGRHRGTGIGGGHDEREQTLNQLLVEMDGFGTASGTIVMAATNRPDILDPALLRPGRFDRQVTVNYPDIKGREAILQVHAKNKPMEEAVDFRKVAQSTVGFTGADLANLLNEAALLSAKKNKTLIGMEEIDASMMKSLLGPQKKSKVRTEKDNRLTAYHEAGHAVVSYYCEHTDPVRHITIIPSGRAGGVTVSVPQEDVSYTTRGQMIDDIRMSLGGRIAEELIMGDISTGASSDIQHATKVAREMVTRYGMTEALGTVLYGNEHGADEVFLGRDYSSGKNYSEETAARIDREIQSIITDAYDYARNLLKEHGDKLELVAQYLLHAESMDGDQFNLAMTTDATNEELDALAEEKREQSRKDNERRAKELEEQERAEAEAKAKAEAEAMENGDTDIENEENNDENDNSHEGN